MENLEIKTGTDPEFFVTKNGVVVSSIGLVGGTKKRPKVLNDYCNVHEDNVAVECSVVPADNVEDFLLNVKVSIESVRKDLKDKGDGYDISNLCSYEFSEDVLSHRKAKKAGCDKDYDAFTNKENPTPDLSSTNLRSCGGHIHTSYPHPDQFMTRQIVKAYDIFLGVPSVILDKDRSRRDIYGKASAFRHKPYGLEYRTLSNFWLQKEDYIRWAYNSASEAAKMVITNYGEVDEDVATQAREIINGSLTQEAIQFCIKYNIEMP